MNPIKCVECGGFHFNESGNLPCPAVKGGSHGGALVNLCPMHFRKECVECDWPPRKPYEVDLLRAENEDLRKKLTTVHFVCDRIPGKDGCRFIELENPEGYSLGDEAGEWEIRPDGLAQLVVSLSDESLRKDAERYRLLRGIHVQGELRIGVQYENARTGMRVLVAGEQLDAIVDGAMSKETP